MSDQSEALRLAGWLDSLDVRTIEKIQNVVSSAAELRRQHSRIEADEALMRTALYELGKCVDWPCANAETDATITALRKRLESSNG